MWRQKLFNVCLYLLFANMHSQWAVALAKVHNKQIYRHVQLCFFRRLQYAPDCNQNFCRIKYFAIYAATTYSMTPNLLGLLQPPFFKPFPNLVKYKNNGKTYKYT